MDDWVNIAILVGFLALLAVLWRLGIPSPQRLPWLVWAPDLVLLGWAVYGLWTGRWSNAVIAAIVLPIWFARTYPLWRARHQTKQRVE
jgi:hypothetical protein